MARKQVDPFGFLGAINWDVVDQHADEIAAIFEGEDPGDVDLPEGYRWATADETERGGMDIPGAMMVTRTFDSTGRRYTEGEADLAVPEATDLDYEPCCRAYTQRLGGGDHEWGCPNY